MSDALRSNQRFCRQLPESLDFSEYTCEPIRMDRVLIWITSKADSDHTTRPCLWIFKCRYSLGGVDYIDFSSGIGYLSAHEAMMAAIAIRNEITAYLDQFLTRLYCPSSLAPVFTGSRYLTDCINTEETDRRILRWYALNFAHFGGSDKDTRLWNLSVQTTRQFTLRLRMLWFLQIDIHLNSISIMRDPAISRFLYYCYGTVYGLKGDQFFALIDELPF